MGRPPERLADVKKRRSRAPVAAGLEAFVRMMALLSAAGSAFADDCVSRIDGLRWWGATTIPARIAIDDAPFGGISGLDRTPDGTYLALSDDGGERGKPRRYSLRIATPAPGDVRVTVDAMVPLQRPDGQPFPSGLRTVDPEAIRWAASDRAYWASEGVWHPDPARRHRPFVRAMGDDGRFIGDIALAPGFDFSDDDAAGPRPNKGVEALAAMPDGRLLLAPEEALRQDGPIASIDAGSVLRVWHVDPSGRRPSRQYAYALPAIPVEAERGSPVAADNGLVDWLALDDRRVLAVERAFARGVGNTITLVEAAITDDTTEVGDWASLVGRQPTPMTRRPLLTLGPMHAGTRIDNLEAIAWGPRLPNGRRSLVLAADDNFDVVSQANQFVVLDIIENSGCATNRAATDERQGPAVRAP